MLLKTSGLKILVAGCQHETNTFAPSKADWAAFNRGDSFPAFVQGPTMLDRMRGVNIPIGGFMDAARTLGWQLVPSSWCGAMPSPASWRRSCWHAASNGAGASRRHTGACRS